MTRRALAALLAMATLSGCGVDGIRLPGAPPHGPSYVVEAEFADVLDLVPQAAVRVNDVAVGSVEKIRLTGWRARVRMRIERGVRLPANAGAELRQSSLLGEKFVSLTPPVGEPAAGSLADGALIPLARTARTAEVEEVLAAFGLLLNNGGLAQLRTINVELGRALAGRSSSVRDLLGQLNTLLGGLDAQKADITRAIDALDALSGKLAGQRRTIGSALDALGPGLRVLADQREQLTAALTALSRLSTVGTDVIERSRDETLANLSALKPILTQLVRAGDDLPKALNFMLAFPFPPNVRAAIKDDRVNLHVTLDLDAAVVLANLVLDPDTAAMKPSKPVPAEPKPTRPARPAATPTPAPAPGAPGLPGVPGVPGLPGVPLPSVSVGLPSLPLPDLPLPDLPLPDLPLPDLPGVNRDCGPTGLLTGCDQP